MSLKKRLLSVMIVAAAAAAVLFVGLSNMTVNTEVTDSLFHRKETIYFWYTDEALTDYVNSAAVSFGESNDVRVIPVYKPGMEYLEAVNQASLDEEEQIPDLYLLSNDSLGKAYLAGLTDEVDGGSVCNAENFPQAALSAVTYDNRLVAYPYYYETSVYLYNKTYLEDFVKAQIQAEAEEGSEDTVSSSDQNVVDRRVEELLPGTMDELRAFADSYVAPETVESILKWDVSDIFYNYYFIGKYMVVGGEAGDDVNQVDIYNLNAINCLKAYQELNQFFYIEPKEVTYDGVLQEFIDGKVVFSVVTNDAIAVLEKAKEEGSFPYEYGVVRVPRISEELEGRSLSVTNTVAVNGYSANKELAHRFASYLTTEYVEDLYARTGKVAASYRAPYANENMKVFMEEYEQSIPMPKMIETSNFWIELEIVFSRVWGGENINDLIRSLSEQMMLQITGEPYTEEYIEEPQEEQEESVEYIDDGEEIDPNAEVDQ